MKVRDFCKAFDWHLVEESETSFMPAASAIIIENVGIKDDSLSLRIRGEDSDLLFRMLDEKSADKLCAVLRAHLTLDGPLFLQQLGDIDLYL